MQIQGESKTEKLAKCFQKLGKFWKSSTIHIMSCLQNYWVNSLITTEILTVDICRDYNGLYLFRGLKRVYQIFVQYLQRQFINCHKINYLHKGVFIFPLHLSSFHVRLNCIPPKDTISCVFMFSLTESFLVNKWV